MRNIRKLNVRTYFLYYFTIYAAISVFSAYINLYYLKSGFSLFQIGILSAVGPLFSLFIQPIWAMISDKSGKRRLILRLSLIGSAATVLLYMLYAGFAFFVAATVLFMLFYTAITPLSDTITVADVTGAGHNYSIVRMGGSIGYSVVVVLLGGFFTRHIDLIFWLTSALLCLGLLVSSFFPHLEAEEFSPQQDVETPPAAFNKRKMLFLICYAAVIFFSLSFNFSFVGIYAKQMHCSGTMLGITLFASSISEVPVLLLITKFSRQYQRLNIITVLFVSGFLLGLRLLLYFYAQNVAMVIVAQSLQGITSMTVFYSMVIYINREVPAKFKSTGQSMLAVAQSGIGSILGSAGGGYLSNQFGLRSTYLIVCVTVFGATALFAGLYALRHVLRVRHSLHPFALLPKHREV